MVNLIGNFGFQRRKYEHRPHRRTSSYRHEIPSREAILKFLSERRQLLKLDRLAPLLGMDKPGEVEGLYRRLQAMVRDGQLIQNRRGGYGVSVKLDLVAARIQSHPDGYGFAIPDEPGEDFYLSPKQMRRELHGDRVLVSLKQLDRRGRKEGAIVEILERANSHMVGRYYRDAGIGFVVPDEKKVSQDVLIPPGQDKKAREGEYVYLEITEQPDAKRGPIGHILEVLGGSINAPMAAELAIRSHGIPSEWPDSLKSELAKVPDHVGDINDPKRRDLRKLPLVTIDGADAKDFDDAVYAKAKKDGGWQLIVAIADVSAYVQPGSELDQIAMDRGTSVYFPNRVVPMLPESLSNGICSLKPKVDRLCMVCDIHYKADGSVSRSRFYSAVMHSKARLTYDQAAQFLKDESIDLAADVSKSLHDLNALYHALLNKRRKRGAIEFDSTDVGFRFDHKGEVDAILPRERNDAHRIIEECMIAANVQAAKWLIRRKMVGPFRVHATPSERKLDDLSQSLLEFGITLPAGDQLNALHISAALERVQGKPEQAIVSALLLRAQSLAVYQLDNIGHFGLALEAYSHFTSPIRRYPDLLLHRAIKQGLEQEGSKRQAYDKKEMARLCQHSSMTERRAEEASRDVDERLKCAYMERHIGDVFEGTVTGVTHFGLFIELKGLKVSGLVHITMLPNDYYHFDPSSHTLTGERRRKVFRLADQFKVEVHKVSVDERTIDLKLTDE